MLLVTNWVPPYGSWCARAPVPGGKESAMSAQVTERAHRT